jgi:hypothetical protein
MEVAMLVNKKNDRAILHKSFLQCQSPSLSSRKNRENPWCARTGSYPEIGALTIDPSIVSRKLTPIAPPHAIDRQGLHVRAKKV